MKITVLKDSIGDGVKYMLISTFCFTVMQGLIKYLPQNRIPTVEQMFFRSIIPAVCCSVFMVKNQISFKIKNMKLIWIRSIVGTFSMFAFFYVLPRMPLGTSVTVKYLSPVFTALFAGVMLNEVIKPRQWVYIVMAFVGVLLLKGFDSRVATMDLFIALISAITGGLLYIILRQIGDDDHPFTVVFYFMLIASGLSAMAMLPYWVTPNMEDGLVFLGIGIAGFIAQIYMTKAFQEKDDANFLAQFKYLEAAYAIIIGYFVFDEAYTVLSFLGIVLIFTSLILTIRLKSKEKIEKSIENA
ncbi:MAG: DMT family transporter [Saprospiraceae bacterium]|nr:DMT family transporter [Saprospiraceae bacterium]